MRQVQNRRIAAQVLFFEKLIDMFIDPDVCGHGQVVEHVLAKRAFLGDVFEQVLAVHLPAQLRAARLAMVARREAGLAADS